VIVTVVTVSLITAKSSLRGQATAASQVGALNEQQRRGLGADLHLSRGPPSGPTGLFENGRVLLQPHRARSTQSRAVAGVVVAEDDGPNCGNS
jgi:hypothetical protein